MKKRTHRVLSLLLAAALVLPMVPAVTLSAAAAGSDAGSYVAVLVGQGTIGNGDCSETKENNVSIDDKNGYAPTNLFGNFRSGSVPGFTVEKMTSNVRWEGYDGVSVERGGDEADYIVKFQDNPVLAALAKSSTAQYSVSGYVTATDDDYHAKHAHYVIEQADVSVSEKKSGASSFTQILYCHAPRKSEARENYNTGWKSLQNMTELKIHVNGYNKNGSCPSEGRAQAKITLLIKDSAKPTLQSYICTNSATVNTNDSKELLVKLGTTGTPNDPDNRYYDFGTYATAEDAMKSREWIDLQFNFSKPVSMSSPDGNGNLQAVGDADFEAIGDHTLFTNTMGTGYLNQGTDRGLELYKAVDTVGNSYGSADGGKLTKVTQTEMQHYMNSISYRYVATYSDFNGNHEIESGGGIEDSNAYGVSLLQKIYNAGFHDAAGNPLSMPSGSAGVNIFDKSDGGYDVIVDAVPPTYTRVGNGVTPDILTQLVLNENDTVDFIVSFSEAVITNRSWDNAKTYLMLNNGGKAYYRSKSDDGKQWTFRYVFSGATTEEASLLKVIALGNDALDGSLAAASKGGDAGGKSNNSNYTFNVDGRTITDYVGNVMVERANEDSTTNQKQIQSSTGWAGLAVDNTPPVFADFRYNVYGTGTLTQATGDNWGQAAKIFSSASDPDVPVAPYDPDYDAVNNPTRPSKGIYRPDTTTGSTAGNDATPVGLIFYVWTRSVTPPSAGENFEAIKRYSLTGEQPKTVTARDYHTDWAWDGASLDNYIGNLMMANNFTDILPPDEAMSAAGTGAWYLHVWTADMSWDSARQLMQYDKARALQYSGSYDNASFLTLKADAIETYRTGDAPSYKAAWSAVMPDVYTGSYTDQFLAWLDEGSGGRYSDAAMDYALTKAAAAAGADESARYNSGYSAASLTDEDGSARSVAVASYITANTPAQDDAWTDVKATVYSAAFSDGVVSWLAENSGVNDTLTRTSVAADISTLLNRYASERARYGVASTTTTTGSEGEKKTVVTYYDNITGPAKIAELKTAAGDNWGTQRGDAFLQVYSLDFLCWLTGIDRTDAKYVPNVPDNATEEQEDAAAAEAENLLKADLKAKLNGEAGDTYDSNDAVNAALALAVAAAYGIETEATETTAAVSYTADGVVALIASSVSAYITANTPTAADAWLAVRGDVYAQVYTTAFLGQLDASGYDRYSEAAVAYVVQKETEAQIYKDSYEAAQALKAEAIQNYITSHTSSAPKDPTPSYDDSWTAVKETVYSTAYSEQFLVWLDESGSDRYSDAAMIYARAKAMLAVGQYSNTTVWPLTDFTRADSNWTERTTRLLLDNTVPTAAFDTTNMIGDGTISVELPVTVSDAMSGIDLSKIYYQWVLKREDNSQTYAEVDWTQVESTLPLTQPVTIDLRDGLTTPANYGKATATFTVGTLSTVLGDGEYILYIKYSDVANNVTITHADFAVTVDSTNAIVCTFGPEDALTGYRNAVTPAILVEGVAMVINDTEVGKVTYAVTDSLERPAADTFSYATLSQSGTDATGKLYALYTVPTLDRADGTWYVHTLVYENASQSVEPHYYRQAYRLDRTEPTITINPDGFDPGDAVQSSMEVVVSAYDALSGLGENIYYLINNSGDAIAEGAGDWLTLPTDGRVALRTTSTELTTYYLHVKVSDLAGNTSTRISTAFKLRAEAGAKEPVELPAYECQILVVDAPEAEGGRYHAVANLTLDIDNKAGYRYSVTTDGKTWCDWLPYMSMIRLDLPNDYTTHPEDLQVKFRDPDGNVGTKQRISIQTVENAIWATAEFDSTFKRKSGVGHELTFLMEKPEGVTITATGDPTAVAAGTDFTVTANGVYTFALTRGATAATSPLIVVVDIFDDTPPSGYVTYSEVAPTNGTVLATAKAAETVYVKSLKVKYSGETEFHDEAPKFQFSFQKNGTAEFVIADQAGNETTLTATVTNIDTTPPGVKVVPNYDLYQTVGENASLIASGTTLEVRKKTSSELTANEEIENFMVVNNDRYNTMEAAANGTYTFIVRDNAGNVALATREVGNIVKTLPRYTVNQYFVGKDESNNETLTLIADNAEPKRGEVRVKVSFDAITDGRKLYGGLAPIDEMRDVMEYDEAAQAARVVNKRVTNELTQEDGKYVYTRTFSANGTTAVAICDNLGNVERIPIEIKSLDNEAPVLTLERETAVVDSGTEWPTDVAGIKSLFGGYTVTDNVSKENEITVTVERTDDAPRVAAAQAAVTKAQTVLTEAETALTAARAAAETAQTALNEAKAAEAALDDSATDEAKAAAAAATTEKQKALTNATTAQGKAQTAVNNAQETLTKAQAALTKAQTAVGKLDEVGVYTLKYTATDKAGNSAYAEQTLVVIPSDGLLVRADGVLLSSLATNTSILPSNKVTFEVDPARIQAMFYGKKDENGARTKVRNSKMEYDIFYVNGLYREGQLKNIATRINSSKLTYEDLTKGKFKVTFPEAGWYTIIIRNQERTREYTTFFVASKDS